MNTDERRAYRHLLETQPKITNFEAKWKAFLKLGPFYMQPEEIEQAFLDFNRGIESVGGETE
jgi:hypothetical protein